MLLIILISGTFFLKAAWGSWQTMMQDCCQRFKINGKISTKSQCEATHNSLGGA